MVVVIEAGDLVDADVGGQILVEDCNAKAGTA
jgi:hypothetical protein